MSVSGREALASQHILMEFLRGGQEVSFTARGASMWPRVRDGAVLTIRPVTLGTLCVGDLAAVDRRGALIVHRVIARTATHVTLQGDSLASPDGAFGREQVLGVATLRSQPSLNFSVPSAWHLLALWRWGLSSLRRRVRSPFGLNASSTRNHP